ncbi:hypothetical protein F9B77_10480 [Staphylococcus epidermidis]|uniref:Uncharacterized protein n=2 Tax=Staphylococcus epidermidis TaxID=1282 RepID=Q5HLP2_STAEQ|nr:hypothetical protein SE_1931 [Staphylococcus epidermidis ATCC 12228]AAW52816.1 hypothetical protein SERP1943 [Staphylococcus epidermidis RP62A]ARG65915.1 hypothetical protein B4U56_02755 [Staphylococcus epidermidis]EES57198.1 hypothetical protein HMPREF0789_2223 [Staphylococcus epidermidis BCM-HMP0060]EGG62918.1 hypothetical protein SEVCU144_2229 [Staphylococcus epidermidis VCU144]EGG70128.1 hypothetical protein SEVCU028_0229 [Staphylococcus epidermidis VCU028]EGS79290.1 hypothetical prote
MVIFIKKDKLYIISIEFVFFTYPETLCLGIINKRDDSRIKRTLKSSLFNTW